VKILFVKYLTNTNTKDTRIVLSSELINRNDIVYTKILLHVGYWKRELSVKYIDNWPVDTIGLSKNLSNNFILPDSIPYKIRFEGRNIYIGPVIGLLFATKHKTLTPEFLSTHKCYLLKYNDVKGLVFICSIEGINIENQTIKGYFYEPDSDGSWVEGEFPYPDALYRRVVIPNKKYEDLIVHMGDRIFNTYFFNKWELWECLSPYKEIKPYLPHTEKLTDTSILINMLKQYDSVYLKKASGERSLGIYRVRILENGYEFLDKMGKQYILANVEEISNFLKSVINKNGSYIVQQEIKEKKIENRSFDMRVILQKDENKEWSCTSMIARFGNTGGITSNIWLSSMAMRGKEALKRIFNLTEEEAIMKEKDIINVCSKACEILNKSIGHYGDLGIDVIIDENQKVWILEINKLHYHLYPMYALKDRQMYLDVVSTPLRYASALAEF
jgi:hypothetical protein